MKRLDPPDIDSRDTGNVIRQTSALAKALSGWSPVAGQADAGTALIGAFASMAQQVITRLNQMPNRNFLAYLRMLGLQPRPPRAAEVPLTFTPSAGTHGVRVPAGTQVRGQHPDGTRAAFYTSSALELLSSRNQAAWRAITYQPPDSDGVDRVSFNTAQAAGEQPGYYQLFVGDEPVEHAIYLAADEVLGAAVAAVELSIRFSLRDDAENWEDLQEPNPDDPLLPPVVIWEYCSDDGDWASLDPEAGSGSITDNSDGSSSYCFQFGIPADMDSCALAIAPEPTRAYWIRARLTAWSAETSIPAWCGVTLVATEAVEIIDASPEQIQCNGVPIDTSKDYYPLGQQPAFNDCCTIVYDSIPSASDATVTVNVIVSESNADPKTSDDAMLVWEVASGNAWSAVGVPTVTKDDTTEELTYTETNVARLKETGTVTFSLPAGADQPVLRIRLASGSYGTGVTVSTDDTDPTDSTESSDTKVVDNGYRPPILHRISASIAYTPSAAPVCVTDNGEGCQWESFEQPVTPFERRDDDAPAFYLAFGESLGQASVSMYLEVAPLSPEGQTPTQLKDEVASPGDDSPAKVQWQYYTTTSAGSSGDAPTPWQTLEVADGTHDFAQSGFLRFVAPADHVRSAQFGSAPLYWLRARLASGAYKLPPCAGRLLPNSVAANNAQTIRDEVLGSSRQTPGQTFVLAHASVLADPVLTVREPALPSDDDTTQLRAKYGPLAVVPVAARTGTKGAQDNTDAAELGAAWVRWTQVGSFAASGPQDRHYTLDHESGAVTFGDGRNGMVPPAGNNNIVMARYRSGGGVVGNLPAGAINQLANAVANVATVDNAIASAGGADGESSDAVMDWGPSTLRHRGRATARQDYEDLVRLGFPQIAKVCAIPPAFDPTAEAGAATGAGHVLVAVVPDDRGSDRPAPSLGLLQQIGDYLRERMPPAVRLNLSGPDWLVVDVTVTVVAKRVDRAGALESEVERALCRFLNPLSGGFDHTGWALGQMVHDSDVMRCLMRLPGVDSVSSLRVTRATPAVPELSDGTDSGMPEDTADQQLTAALVCSGDHIVVAKPAESV